MRDDQEINKKLDGLEEKLNQLSAAGGMIPRKFMGYEYKSEKTLWGLPLIHIAQGIDLATGRPRIAKGIIAIGNVARGDFI